jgi:hypothetical protein
MQPQKQALEVREMQTHTMSARKGRWIGVLIAPSGSCAVQMVAKPDHLLEDMQTGKKGEQVSSAFITAFHSDAAVMSMLVTMRGDSAQDGDVSLLDALHGQESLPLDRRALTGQSWCHVGPFYSEGRHGGITRGRAWSCDQWIHNAGDPCLRRPMCSKHA